MKYLYTLLLSLSLINGFSQRKLNRSKKGMSIFGIIKNENKDPVSFATASILDVNTKKIISGAMTDDNGKYFITGLKTGKYILKIISISPEHKLYSKEILIERGNTKPFNIVLESNTEALDEITLTGESTTIVNKIDRRVVNVGKDLTVGGADATFVMSNIPSVDVDQEGEISLRGSSNVSIMVDGRMSSLDPQDLLESIPADAIDKIEIITNPSSKYDPEGASGIINIITKRDNMKGFSGSVNTGIGSNEKYNGGFNFIQNNKKISWSINYNYRYNRRDKNIAQDTENFLSQTNLNTNKDGIDRNNRHNIKSNIDYFINKSQRISYSLSINARQKTSYENTFRNFLDLNNNLLNTNRRIAEGSNDRFNHSHNINYRKEFDSKEHYIEFDYSGNFREGEGNNTYKNIDSIIQNINTIFLERDNNNSKNSINLISLDYTNLDDNGKGLEAGLKATLRSIESPQSYDTLNNITDTYFNVPNRTSDVVYNEQVYAGYVTYSNNLGDVLDYKIGLRVEQTNLEVENRKSKENSKGDYLSFFPTVHLLKKIEAVGEMSLNYSRRISRPRGRTLDPTIIYTDDFRLRHGNPNLQAQFTNSVELNYLKTYNTGSISSAIFFRHSDDIIQRINSVDASNVTTNTWDNTGTSTDYGFEFTLQNRFKKVWNLMANFNAYYVNLQSDDADFTNDGVNWNFRINNNFILPKGFSAQLMSFYNGKKVFAQGYLEPFYRINLGVQKFFLDKKLQLGFRVSDIFNTMKYKVRSSQENKFNNFINLDFETRIAYLTLTYKFNSGKIRKSKRKKKEKESNLGGDLGGF